jgi:hypothetical protein
MLGGIKRGMLAGQDLARLETARRQGVSDGCKLDRFEPGADNQPYVCNAQSSP